VLENVAVDDVVEAAVETADCLAARLLLLPAGDVDGWDAATFGPELDVGERASDSDETVTEVVVERAVVVVVDKEHGIEVAIDVVGPATEPKLAGLGWIVVSMKFAVVNFPDVVVFDAAVAATVDATVTDHNAVGDL